MKDIPFEEYRNIFYFFQYQFYLRSERASKKGMSGLLPNGAIGQFLFKLAEYPDEMHFRWEPIDKRPRSFGRSHNASSMSLREHNRIKKLSKNPPDHFPIKPGQGQATFYKAKIQSIRCKYMIFEFPKMYRKDQILSLYKSLIVFDRLTQYGFTRWDTAKTVVGKNISDVTKYRATSSWERLTGLPFESKPFMQELDEWNGTLKQLFATSAFTTTAEYLGAKKEKTGKGCDPFDHLRNLHGEIARYYQRALELTELAQIGNFKQYPSLLSK